MPGLGWAYSCGESTALSVCWVQPTLLLCTNTEHATALCGCAKCLLISVMTALHCAQHYCCSLCTVGMNLAVWLCYNITGLWAAQLCQAHVVCCVSQWCWQGWVAALGTLQFCHAPAGWSGGFVQCQAGRGQRGWLLACLVGMCRIRYVICTWWGGFLH